MRIVTSLDDWPRGERCGALTIGVFDGVHVGHQAIVKTLTRVSDRLPSTLLTFEPHPDRVVGRAEPPFLTTFEQKVDLLESLGLSSIVVEPFTPRLAATEPEAFMERLSSSMAPLHVVLGERSRFGRNGRGDLDMLRSLGQRLGFLAVAVPPVEVHSRVVSSTAIRSEIMSGNMDEATDMLGRLFSVRGRVVPGDGRGRLLGFPTANVDLSPGQVVPEAGVYSLLVHLGSETMGAVGNIGLRPTFGKTSICFEVHMLGFSGDVYGKTLDVDFVQFLRPETKFDGPDSLIQQVERDKHLALLCLRQRRLIENNRGS